MKVSTSQLGITSVHYLHPKLYKLFLIYRAYDPCSHKKDSMPIKSFVKNEKKKILYPVASDFSIGYKQWIVGLT